MRCEVCGSNEAVQAHSSIKVWYLLPELTTFWIECPSCSSVSSNRTTSLWNKELFKVLSDYSKKFKKE